MFRLAISLKIGATMRPVFPSSGKRFYKKKSWKMQRKKASSLDNFQAFYSEQFGKDWPSIIESLSQTTQHCAVVNKFSSQEEVHEKLSSTEAEFLNISIFNSHEDIQNELQLNCYFPNSSNRVRFPKQDKTSNGYFDYYLLDASSMLPVLALDIYTNNAVLDMCAAPGGKTVLVSQLLSNHGSLVASEISNTRRANLIKVIKDYIPKISKSKDLVEVRNLTGHKFATYEPSTYDRVLVDAPCSSDRHNLQTNFEYSVWSEMKSKANANLQKKLLLSALQTVVPGGIVVYSTCSMSVFENDAVIDEVLSKCKQNNDLKVEVLDSQFTNQPIADMFNFQQTQNGILVLPSKKKNWGPLYFCKLQRFAVESEAEFQEDNAVSSGTQ